MNKWKNKLTNMKKKLPYYHNKIIDSLNCPKINKIKSTDSNKKSKKMNKSPSKSINKFSAKSNKTKRLLPNPKKYNNP